MGSLCPPPRVQSLGRSGVQHPEPACDQSPSSVCSQLEPTPPSDQVAHLRCIPSFDKHLLSTYCMPGTFMGSLQQ